MRDEGSESLRGGGLSFTDTIRRLHADALSEADRLRHDYIGTEHLVLAMALQAKDTVPLARLGLDWERIRDVLEENLRPGKVLPAADMAQPYTSRTKKAFSLAAESAREAGHGNIGVEHLLVGLLRERGNIGAEVLQQCGLTEEQAAAQVQQIGAGGGAE